MKATGITPILNVSDVAASIRWFGLLGWNCGFTYNDEGESENGAEGVSGQGQPSFASVCSGDAQIFLCLDGQDCAEASLRVLMATTIWAQYG